MRVQVIMHSIGLTFLYIVLLSHSLIFFCSFVRTFWSLIRPFVDPTTKEKIVFCHGKKGLEQIVNDVGTINREKYLEKCAGGVDTLPPVLSKEYLTLPFHMTFGEE